MRRLLPLALVVFLCGCGGGGGYYDVLLAQQCLDRGGIDAHNIGDEKGDDTLTLEIDYGRDDALTLSFYPSGRDAADTEDAFTAMVRNADPRYPWAKFRSWRRGNVLLGWYGPLPEPLRHRVDACLDEAREHPVE